MEMIMEPAILKEKLHHYIDVADERMLQAMYTILEEAIEGDYLFTAEEINMFNERRQKHLNGESKSYSVEEAHNLIRQNRKANGL